VRALRTGALALALIGGVACRREAPEPDPTPRPDPTASSAPTSTTTPTTTLATSPSPTPTASGDVTGLAKSIAEATARAPKECKEAERVVVPGGRGVMIRYACGAFDFLQTIAAGEINERRYAHIALEPSVHGFWTPLGPDKKYMAIRKSSCGPPEGCRSISELIRFSNDVFDEALSLELPWALQPAAQIDFDHDGQPELVVPGWRLKLAGAPSGCTPAEGAAIEDADQEPKLALDGLVAWSPTTKAFSTSLRSFAGWYAMRLSAARSVGKHLAAGDAGTCPVETLRTAAEIAIYGRVLGEDGAKLDAEAEAVGARRAEWPAVRTAIGFASIPQLVDAR
jgi:hypothetical protein